MLRLQLSYRFATIVAAACAMASCTRGLAADVRLADRNDRVTVTIDGDLFVEYRFHSGHQPVIWPIIGPGGQPMTRQYPLGPKLDGEPQDHPHHRSLWFNHGSVNGLDFWMEPPADGAARNDNQIIQRTIKSLEEAGGRARIVTTNDWTSNGRKVCEDVRSIEFTVDDAGRWIDFAIELRASEGEITLGDTKEGCFGIRVPGSMAVDAKLGGRILNSRGFENEAAWGRAAEWVDYRGPVAGQTVGITVFSLPDSFRHPCRWHVRTYGLFAANPIGQHDFPSENGDAPQGTATIAKGGSLRFHYRILFSTGERTAADLHKLNATLPTPNN